MRKARVMRCEPSRGICGLIPPRRTPFGARAASLPSPLPSPSLIPSLFPHLRRFLRERVVGIEGVRDVPPRRQQQDLLAPRMVVHPTGYVVHLPSHSDPQTFLCVVLGYFLPCVGFSRRLRCRYGRRGKDRLGASHTAVIDKKGRSGAFATEAVPKETLRGKKAGGEDEVRKGRREGGREGRRGPNQWQALRTCPRFALP